MNDSYRTISGSSKGLYKEKGSKFIAFAYPVHKEQEIKKYLDGMRKEYHDARHHCYAWRLGPDKERYRANDDGEPSGSAGKPILGQLQSFDITDVLVVVIRYFGGTLLGVGGLINAYRSATSDALSQARIVERKVYGKIKLDFSYEQMNSVMKLVKDYDLKFEDQDFQLECSMGLKVWIRKMDEVRDAFSKIRGCKINLIEE